MSEKKLTPTKSKKTKRAPQTEANAPAKKTDLKKRVEGTPEKATGESPPQLQSEPAATIESLAGGQTGKELFPIVGVGASAGGLEAFTSLLQHLPVDTGMGFVLIQHLDPVHESILAKLLSKATSMPVREVTNNTRVEPNQVYVIPPNTSLAIAESVLKLLPRKKEGGQHRPIDSFYQSLAEDRRERAISVILSGTASDGTLGCEAIKAEGGITFAQDESAKYNSMPRSAIAAGCIDFVLSPENIAKELAQIARHPYVVSDVAVDPIGSRYLEKGIREFSGGSAGKAQAGAKKDPFEEILVLLENSTGVDFSLYKPNTIKRRIGRRMVLTKIEALDSYLHHLKSDAKEREALYQDMLISVTGFFRNPEAFEVLKRRVFPAFLKNKSPNDSSRIWVLGCASGQEAYSLAMSYLEFAGKANSNIPVQIFATDLNDGLLEKARAGLYSKTLVNDLSPERLRRFFNEEDGGHRISKTIRDMCVFARQNILTDPPFSRMDLISCRNLLIYLESALNKKIIPIFHYGLKPNGFLFLGASETVGASADLFATVDKKYRIYSKKPVATPRLTLPLPSGYSLREKPGPGRQQLLPREGSELNAQKEADRITLSKYAPAGVLVNADLEILQFRGGTSRYLAPAPGRASFNLLKMAREGLLLPLRTAINKAKKENQRIRKENVQVDQNGDTRTANIEVIPLKNLQQRCFLILFEAAERPLSSPVPEGEALEHEASAVSKRSGRGVGKVSARAANDQVREIAKLKRELAETRDYLQSTLEEHEAVNEELQASNEEVQSANEELQSINEELETSKEELESTNEELTTVNEEMQHRNEQLNRVNSDLNNLHSSISLSIVVLARDLTIRGFTPLAEKELNLIAADIGQPISRVKTNLDFPGLEALIAEVIKTASVRQTELQDKTGRWYSLRVRPYLTLDNKIDGAVLVLVDIDVLKRSEALIKEAHDYAASIVETVRAPLMILDEDLRIQTASRSYYQTFKATPEETENQFIYDLGNGQWKIPELSMLLEDIVAAGNEFQDFEVEHEFKRIGRKTMLLGASEISQDANRRRLILLEIEDISERKRAQEKLRTSEIRYRRLFETAREGILILDELARKITDVNPFMVELLGYSRDEFLGKELWEIGLMKDAEASHNAFRELQEQGYIRYDDLPLQTQEGKLREVEFVSNVYTEDNQQVIQCHIRDITARKLAERALLKAEERLRLLVEGVRDHAICMLDPKGQIESWNQGVRRILGYEEAEFTGQPLSIIYTPEDIERGVPEQELRTAKAKGRAESEGWRVRRDGTRFWASGVLEPLLDDLGRLRGFSEVMRDITERKEAEGRISHEALHDALTGLPNRALFTEHLKQAIARAERHEDYLYAVLFLDLDRFKNVNDSIGHEAGDQMLVATARKLQSTLRPEDVLARQGGDEFTILLDDIHSVRDATRVASRIQSELQRPSAVNGRDVSTTASIGIAFSTHGYSETEEVLRDADMAMYRAKTLGRGRYEIFDASMQERVMSVLKFEAGLRRAIEREEFCLHYQPIMSLKTNQITGFEALVRWQHPEHGLVLPAEFIPIAEETGLIAPLGHWVLEEACRQLRQWQDLSDRYLSLSVNVNLSCKQFSQVNLIERIKGVLDETGLPAHSLKLEITESTVMEKAEVAAGMIGQLRNLGVEVQIDDFGTGYSSLSYLHHFPVDVLKIDGSFVGRMGTDDESTEIVKTIVQLAHSLGMAVTAEGVETAEQLNQLHALACEYGQGYFFSEPVDGETAKEMLMAA